MIDNDRETAENARLDWRLFLLGDSEHERFVTQLNAPIAPSEALRNLLATPAPWER